MTIGSHAIRYLIAGLATFAGFSYASAREGTVSLIRTISLIGIELAKPLGLDGCPRERSRDLIDLKKVEQLPAPYICSDPMLINSHKRIMWPEKMNSRLNLVDATVLVDEGNTVQQIDLDTRGIQFQTFFLNQLTSKFGPPTNRSIDVIQNKTGTRFEVVTASWSIGTSKVTFIGAGASVIFEDGKIGPGSVLVPNMNVGHIRAYTPKGEALQKEMDDRNARAAPQIRL